MVGINDIRIKIIKLILEIDDIETLKKIEKMIIEIASESNDSD
ncbi:MAG: hypothetical protein AB8G11_00940 [Saprospiraceae bacterium]